MKSRNNLPQGYKSSHEHSETHNLGDGTGGNKLTAIKISRATNSMAMVKKFYNEDINV